MFSGLDEEECTRFKKKGKKIITAKSWFVGMKGYLKTYNHVKYFITVLEPFLNETHAFYVKLSGQFFGHKTEVTWHIVLKFGTNEQPITLKLLSKFHLARSNCSRVKAKVWNFALISLKMAEWKQKNTRRESQSFQLKRLNLRTAGQSVWTRNLFVYEKVYCTSMWQKMIFVRMKLYRHTEN